MVQINFGVSSYSRHSPGVPLRERTMNIPEEGSLSLKIPCSDRYLDVCEVNPEIWNKNEICFKLKEDHSHHLHDIQLRWIEERKEWAAIWHEEWSECDFSVDENEIGPYGLDDYCKNMLSKAYGVCKENLLCDISTINPSELEKIASRGKN